MNKKQSSGLLRSKVVTVRLNQVDYEKLKVVSSRKNLSLSKILMLLLEDKLTNIELINLDDKSKAELLTQIIKYFELINSLNIKLVRIGNNINQLAKSYHEWNYVNNYEMGTNLKDARIEINNLNDSVTDLESELNIIWQRLL